MPAARARTWLRLDAIYCGGAAVIALALAEPLARLLHVGAPGVAAAGVATGGWTLVLVWVAARADLRQPLQLVAAANVAASMAVAVLAAVEPARAARLLLVAVAVEVGAFATVQLRLLATG